MKYFITFRENGKPCRHWKNESGEIPSEVKKDQFPHYEISKDQYDLSRFLTVSGNVVVWNEKHQDYIDKLADKEERRLEILEIKEMISDIHNSDLKPWLKKILKRLVRDMKE